ncbi:gluconokinase [Agreia bicolorata]|uniref:Gluconokinase n=1 Tax=Agreia bicolorata TaxID=110935 RepID=A0A1T4YEL4_9MICO|nr:gluconokinase, GntK/IdnK-type [Agreia bicolorata]SKB00194.1 gluconokinase [Agreia bicolorata]
MSSRVDAERGAAETPPPVIVVMGVAGSGKTTVATILANTYRADFIDAQDLHTPSNRRRLSQGIALTDHDREPWIAAVSERIGSGTRASRPLVIACSALKRTYRDRLRESGPAVFVHLVGERWQIVDRLGPVTQQRLLAPLLESQFAALEPLADDEEGFAVRVTAPVSEVVSEVVRRLAETPVPMKSKRITL